MLTIDRLGELLQRGDALIAKDQPHHPLRTFDAVGLGAAMEEIGHRAIKTGMMQQLLTGRTRLPVEVSS